MTFGQFGYLGLGRRVCKTKLIVRAVEEATPTNTNIVDY